MARKDTTASFIEKARKVHGDRFDYSKVDYANSFSKVCIIDKTNNKEFWQLPYIHLQGCGNPEDTNEKRKKSLRFTKEEFEEKAKKVHGDKYDYSKSDYINNKTKVCIICKKCGNAFWQLPMNHLKGAGCPICGHNMKSLVADVSFKNNRRKSLLEFIEEANLVHNYKYDYRKANYINTHTPIDIICPKHGIFRQTPHNHLQGHGCPYCVGKKKTNDMLISEFLDIHGDEYDYTLVKYVNAKTKVSIICHQKDEDGIEHGIFYQTPNDHLIGKGCPKCANQIRTQEQVIKAFKKIHGDEYDYSQVNYVNAFIKVHIRCIKHDFWFDQTPNSHLNGSGCPKCGQRLSHVEEELYDFIKPISNDAIRNDRKVLEGQELDIYIPYAKLAIEYNGLLWHSDKFGKTRSYHLRKTQECEKQGIHLIHIFEDEWVEHKEIVLSKLKHILGKSEGEKVFARKCITKEIDRQTTKAFLDTNHIQGFALSTVYLGAYYKDELVGVMTFKKEQRNSDKWELTRFATDINKQCVGLGGKMFAYFKENYYFCEVKSFADRRWSTYLVENLYTRMGFELTEVLAPNYRYVIPGSKERHHKFTFRKQRLSKKYNLPLTMTENEMTEALGLYRIWDCGLLKYVFKNK